MKPSGPICALLLLLALALLAGAPPARASGDLLPRPAALEPDIHFWIKVYTQITTNEGYLHDQHDLSIIYETLHFRADAPVSERKARVEADRSSIEAALRRLGTGAAPETDEEHQVHDLWPAGTVPARFAAAADDVRFQLGQADRFRAGLMRAGAWEAHIGEVLANLGLPAEIAALPHVESSFDPTAYSKVGAAGLWQFMRSTGRRFMRIDGAVDERLDPFRATEAAAQLLSYNYRLLGSWPLAITAYNHGAAGMLRARQQLGTDDIVRIVRDYHSPTFGFASRNFYVSFLAALSISSNPDKYFGSLHRASEPQFVEVRLSSRASGAALARALGVDRESLRELNPALRPSVWSGRRPVPAGYIVRLPSSKTHWTPDLLAQRLGAISPELVASEAAPAAAPAPVAVVAHVGRSARLNPSVPLAPGPLSVVAAAADGASGPQMPGPSAHTVSLRLPTSLAQGGVGPDGPQYYLVQSDDTVQSIADRTGVTVARLMQLNSIPDADYLYGGERLRLAAAAPEPETQTTAATLGSAQAAVLENEAEAQAVSAAGHAAGNAEPVAAAQQAGPQLVPGVTAEGTADPVDYSVSKDGTIRVVAAETLGHYADWLDTSAQQLRMLNRLGGRRPVVMGRRLRLTFAHVSPAQFEQRRRDYHEHLQAAYFASHRIAGTEVYVAHRGDSLWSITQRAAKVPIWLLQQYNPELDFSDLKPGTQVSLPRVEDVSGM